MEIGEIIKQIVEGNNLFMNQHSKEYFDGFKLNKNLISHLLPAPIRVFLYVL